MLEEFHLELAANHVNQLPDAFLIPVRKPSNPIIPASYNIKEWLQRRTVRAITIVRKNQETTDYLEQSSNGVDSFRIFNAHKPSQDDLGRTTSSDDLAIRDAGPATPRLRNSRMDRGFLVLR
jgi:hypothetical protein